MTSLAPAGSGGPLPVAGWVRRARGLVVTVLVLVLVSAAGVLMLGILREETGSTGLVIGASLACIPVFFVVSAFVWLDRWEPEPRSYLAQAFGWGATVAALVAVIVNSLLARALATSVVAVGVAPFVEEAAKASFLVLFVWLHRREFDGVVDGIVLGGLVAAGFAFTENILYFGRAWVSGVASGTGDVAGIEATGSAFVLRGLLSPFAHPLFTVMTGIGVGIAVTTSVRALRWLAPLGGYLLAVALHATWNASALLDGGRGFFTLYLTIMVPIFLTAAGLAVWSRRREGSVLRRELPAYVAAGWIAPWEVTVLSSLAFRRRAVHEARQVGGERMRAATRTYHAAATELAFLRERLLRGTAGADAPERQAELLHALVVSRAAAYVPSPTSVLPPGRR